MRRGLTLSHKALILVAVPLVFEFVFVGVLAVLLQKAEFETRKEAHRKAVITESYSLLNTYVNTATIIYLYWLTHQPIFKQQYDDLTNAIPFRINSLKIMLRDSPEQTKALNRMLTLSNRGTAMLDQATNLAEENKQSATKLKSDLQVIIADLLSELRIFVREQEKEDSYDLKAEDRARQMVQICIAVGLAINVILAVALAVFFNRGTTKRLNIMMDKTRDLAEGKPLAEPLSGTDEIAHLDHTFHEMADALAVAAKHKQELISIVSHELRTPLTSVQATLTRFSHGLLGELSPKGKDALVKAEKNTDRLIKLINDLLDIERMEQGKIDLRRENIALSSALGRSLDSVLSFAEKHGVELDVASTTLSVFADEDRLIQVMVNLLSNAIKFSPENGLVTVSVEQIGQNVEIAVADQGRGVPPEFQEKIFQRYAQVEEADGKKGTGLGLPICKAIIEGHGGTIGVRSELGKGSVFSVQIPLADPPK